MSSDSLNQRVTFNSGDYKEASSEEIKMSSTYDAEQQAVKVPTIFELAQLREQNVQVECINFSRLKLLYADDVTHIGQEFIQKYRQEEDSRAHHEKLKVKKRRNSVRFLDYCRENAIFFKKGRGRMIPRLSDSSRVEKDGELRRRGSLIQLQYNSPTHADIKEELRERRLQSPLNKDGRSLLSSMASGGNKLQLIAADIPSCDSIQGEASMNIESEELGEVFEHVQEKRVLFGDKTQGPRKGDSSLVISVTPRLNPDPVQIDPKSSFKTMLMTQGSFKTYQKQDCKTPTLPRSKKVASETKLILSSFQIRRQPSDFHVSTGEMMMKNTEQFTRSAMRKLPFAKLSLAMHGGSFNNLDLPLPINKIVNRRLSVQALNMKSMDEHNPSALQKISCQQLDGVVGIPKLSRAAFQNKVFATVQAGHMRAQSGMSLKSPCLEGESMNSNYTESVTEHDIKAIQFFTQQKMKSWISKIKAVCSPPKQNSRLSHIIARKLSHLSDVLSADLASVSVSSPDTSEEDSPVEGRNKRKIHRATTPLDSDELEGKPRNTSSSIKMALPYCWKKKQPSMKKDQSGAVSISALNKIDQCTPRSKPSTKQDYSQKRKTNQLPQNQFDLTRATQDKEDDQDAELRYARFLMLQSLSQRMKKFYKFEFGHDAEKHVPNFRKASEFIPKRVYEFSRTPSQHDLSLESIEDSSSGLDDSSFMISNRPSQDLKQVLNQEQTEQNSTPSQLPAQSSYEIPTNKNQFCLVPQGFEAQIVPRREVSAFEDIAQAPPQRFLPQLRIDCNQYESDSSASKRKTQDERRFEQSPLGSENDQFAAYLMNMYADESQSSVAPNAAFATVRSQLQQSQQLQEEETINGNNHSSSVSVTSLQDAQDIKVAFNSDSLREMSRLEGIEEDCAAIDQVQVNLPQLKGKSDALLDELNNRGPVDARILAEKLFTIKLKTMSEEQAAQELNDWIVPANKYQYQGIHFIVDSSSNEAAKSCRSVHPEININPPDLATVDEECSKESRSNDISRYSINERLSDFSFVCAPGRSQQAGGYLRIHQRKNILIAGSLDTSVDEKDRHNIDSQYAVPPFLVHQIPTECYNLPRFHHSSHNSSSLVSSPQPQNRASDHRLAKQSIELSSQGRGKLFEDESCGGQQVFFMALNQHSRHESSDLAPIEEHSEHKMDIDTRAYECLRLNSNAHSSEEKVMVSSVGGSHTKGKTQSLTTFGIAYEKEKIQSEQGNATSKCETKSPVFQVASKMSKLRKSRMSLSPESVIVQSPKSRLGLQNISNFTLLNNSNASVSEIHQHKSSDPSFNGRSIAEVQDQQPMIKPLPMQIEEETKESPSRSNPDTNIFSEELQGKKLSGNIMVNTSILDPVEPAEQRFSFGPAQRIIMQRQLSPIVAKVYEKISEEQGVQSNTQHKEDLDCLKQLFVASGKQKVNLIAGLTMTSSNNYGAYNTEPSVGGKVTKEDYKQAAARKNSYFKFPPPVPLTVKHAHNGDRSKQFTMFMQTFKSIDTGPFKDQEEISRNYSHTPSRSTSAAYRKAQRFHHQRSPSRGRSSIKPQEKSYRKTGSSYLSNNTQNQKGFSHTQNLMIPASTHIRDNSWQKNGPKKLISSSKMGGMALETQSNMNVLRFEEELDSNFNDLQIPPKLPVIKVSSIYRSRPTESSVDLQKRDKVAFQLQLRQLRSGDADGGEERRW